MYTFHRRVRPKPQKRRMTSNVKARWDVRSGASSGHTFPSSSSSVTAKQFLVDFWSRSLARFLDLTVALQGKLVGDHARCARQRW